MEIINYQMETQLPNTKSSKGFTLVELMVVIVILAILAVVGITVFSNTQGGARDARRRADIKAISNALETGYTNSSYKALADDQFAGGKIPTDPNGTSYTGYSTSVSTTAFKVCATIESPAGSFCLSNQR